MVQYRRPGRNISEEHQEDRILFYPTGTPNPYVEAERFSSLPFKE